MNVFCSKQDPYDWQAIFGDKTFDLIYDFFHKMKDINIEYLRKQMNELLTKLYTIKFHWKHGRWDLIKDKEFYIQKTYTNDEERFRDGILRLLEKYFFEILKQTIEEKKLLGLPDICDSIFIFGTTSVNQNRNLYRVNDNEKTDKDFKIKISKLIYKIYEKLVLNNYQNLIESYRKDYKNISQNIYEMIKDDSREEFNVLKIKDIHQKYIDNFFKEFNEFIVKYSIREIEKTTISILKFRRKQSGKGEYSKKE